MPTSNPYNTATANAWIRDHKPDESARFRPGYHLAAPVGWLNDPNGLVHVNGEYHAFYQFHPYSSEWGPMHWGHAVSPDMVHWRHMPVALAPDSPWDEGGGCYSGSAVESDGELVLMYTGHTDTAETQNIAVSTDGTTFSKITGNPVIPAAPSDNSIDFRDPKVWRHDGHWYVVLGSSDLGNDGRALIYRSDDLRHWDYLGPLARSEGRLGRMWECPDFFELDGTHVLMMSPVGMDAEGILYRNAFQTGYVCGPFDYGRVAFGHGPFEELDRGHDFYATQTFTAPDGRRICMAWMDMWHSDFPEQKEGWAGMLTLPRELHVVNGRLRMTPVRELLELRESPVSTLSGEIAHDQVLASPSANRFELVFSCSDPRALDGDTGIRLGWGATAVTFRREGSTGRLILDRGGADGERICECATTDHLDLRVFVDSSSIEVFANNGEETFSSRIYPTGRITASLISSRPSIRARSVCYPLRKVMD